MVNVRDVFAGTMASHVRYIDSRREEVQLKITGGTVVLANSMTSETLEGRGGL